MLSDKQENEFRLVLANAVNHFEEFATTFFVMNSYSFNQLYEQAKQSANMCREILKMETVREEKQTKETKKLLIINDIINEKIYKSENKW